MSPVPDTDVSELISPPPTSGSGCVFLVVERDCRTGADLASFASIFAESNSSWTVLGLILSLCPPLGLRLEPDIFFPRSFADFKSFIPDPSFSGINSSPSIVGSGCFFLAKDRDCLVGTGSASLVSNPTVVSPVLGPSAPPLGLRLVPVIFCPKLFADFRSFIPGIDFSLLDSSPPPANSESLVFLVERDCLGGTGAASLNSTFDGSVA